MDFGVLCIHLVNVLVCIGNYLISRNGKLSIASMIDYQRVAEIKKHLGIAAQSQRYAMLR